MVSIDRRWLTRQIPGACYKSNLHGTCEMGQKISLQLKILHPNHSTQHFLQTIQRYRRIEQQRLPQYAPLHQRLNIVFPSLIVSNTTISLICPGSSLSGFLSNRTKSASLPSFRLPWWPLRNIDRHHVWSVPEGLRRGYPLCFTHHPAGPRQTVNR